MKRRSFLLTSSASVLNIGSLPAWAEEAVQFGISGVSDSILDDIAVETADDDGYRPGGEQAQFTETLSRATNSKDIASWYRDQMNGTFEDKLVNNDAEDDPDRAHLSEWSNDVVQTSFELSIETLEFLAVQNNFRLIGPRVIFGFRGLSLSDGSDEARNVRSAMVRLTPVDLRSYKCLMGVWDREQRTISLFSASTVPNFYSVYTFANGGSGANTMPTGLYQYETSRHPASRVKSTSQYGAFSFRGTAFYAEGTANLGGRGTSQTFVLRTLDDYTYSLKSEFDIWHLCHPGNNIHAGVYGYNGLQRGNVEFSSAGCQVVKGSYQAQDGVFSNEPIGPWRNFRKDAGLTEVPVVRSRANRTSGDDGKQYQYMLLSGLEPALYSSSSDFRNRYSAARLGSQGSLVARLQERIGLQNVDGDFGAGTTLKLFEYWQAAGRAPRSIALESDL